MGVILATDMSRHMNDLNSYKAVVQDNGPNSVRALINYSETKKKTQ